MFGLLVFLFTVVPAIEIFLLFKVGGVIGGFNTLLVVIITGVVGAALAKSQGLAILTKIQTDMNSGELPANQIIHGLMVFAGGLLLLTPGFATDVFGFSLVMPGPRHILIIWVKKAIEKGMKNGNIHFGSFGQGQGSASGGFYSHTSYTHTSSSPGANPFEQFERQARTNDRLDGDTFEAEYTKKED